MKRTLAVASVTAAVLVGTGTVSAIALAGGGGSGSPSGHAPAASTAQTAPAGQHGDATADGPAHRRPGTGAAEAAEAAAKAAPGTVTSLDLDRGRHGLVWEADVVKSRTTHEVTLDADSGAVLRDRVDADDDADDRDAVPQRGGLSAADAARRLAGHGTVVSVDYDDDRRGTWEVETAGAHGAGHEWSVGPRSGELTRQPADREERDDRGDHRDQRDHRDHRDRDDDGGDHDSDD